MIVLYIVLAIVAMLLAVGFIVGNHVFRRMCVRHASRPDDFEQMFSESQRNSAARDSLIESFKLFDTLDTEEFSIYSDDGLKLFATAVYANKDVAPKGVVLMFHGYHSAGRRDFCIQIKILHNAGYHILLADQRTHQRSEGKYVCYGTKEHRDVLLWRNKAEEIFGKELPITYMGLSMGGATVLMASGITYKDDGNVRCVVADCPFCTPHEVVAHVLTTRHNMIPYPLLFFINFWCITIAKFSLFKYSSARAVAHTHLPILIFHGMEDDYVKYTQSEKISKASHGNLTLSLYPGANHAECVYRDEERYKKELLDFLDKHMTI